MAAQQHIISIAEYMQTSYQPDREYIDGEVRERNVGKWEHARVQWLLAHWFAAHESEWGVIGSTDQRVQTTATHVRVPDLVVVMPGPQPDILIEPPLLAVEILSPGDTYSDTQERADGYLLMGVKTIWIIDPKTRTGRMCTGNDWTAADTLIIPHTPCYVDLKDLFSHMYTPR